MQKLFSQKYFEILIRVGAYASALYFNKIILSPFLGSTKSFISLIFGILSYEFVNILVKKWYKVPSQKLKLTNEDREFRIQNEIKIMQIIIFYFLYVILSLLVFYFYNMAIVKEFWAGVFGLVLQFFQFLGFLPLAVVVDKKTNNGLTTSQKIASIFISLFFSIPIITYIVITLKIFF